MNLFITEEVYENECLYNYITKIVYFGVFYL